MTNRIQNSTLSKIIKGAALLTLAALAIPVYLASCAKSSENGAPRAQGPGRPLIAVSTLPQKWFADRVSDGKAQVLVLVGEGQDPHSWEPSPRQMASFSSAAAWVLSGTDFETALVPRIREQNPGLRIVDGTEGVSFRQLENHTHGDEEAEEEHEAEALERDRHTWLGEAPALIMADRIAETLAVADAENAEAYRLNASNLKAEIRETFAALREELAPLRGTKVFVYHPAFGYFLDEFGITQEAVETGGKEPTAKHLAALIAEAREDRPAAVFVQAQFPLASAKTLADAVGAKVVALDPLAPDWLANVRLMGKALAEAAR